VLQVKDKFHLGFVLPKADHVVQAFGACLAPQRPGNGIEQCRFAVPIVAREAGGREAGKIERWGILAVTHEVMQSQTERDHASSSSCSSCNSSWARSRSAWRRSLYSGWLTM